MRAILITVNGGFIEIRGGASIKNEFS